jgi:hypothetical protein
MDNSLKLFTDTRASIPVSASCSKRRFCCDPNPEVLASSSAAVASRHHASVFFSFPAASLAAEKKPMQDYERDWAVIL